MGIVWDRSIRHVHRKLKRRDYRLVASSDRATRHPARMGLPSRGLPAELGFEFVKVRVALKTAPSEEMERRSRVLQSELLRSRLLERKRGLRDAVRHRKITRDRTCIYLWKRRRNWMVAAHQQLSE